VSPRRRSAIWSPASLGELPVAGPRVGILALQGGVREHAELLLGLGAEPVYLRTPDDLAGPDGPRIDALVLPGGESSTIDRLLRLFGLFEPLRAAVCSGIPTLGTCAGLVLLAREVLDPAPGQQSLGVLDVAVRRNAFGPQIDSAEEDLDTALGPTRVAFIRAPSIERVGGGVEILASRGDRVVAVRQGQMVGISFHPELTGDSTFHRDLLNRL
jgi:pyridoxal 5'-phosphate synthase pdxT subunit